MQRIPAILCAFALATSALTAQDQRARPKREAAHVRKTIAAEVTTDRRPAIVRLSEPSVVEHIVATSKSVALDTRGAAVADPVEVRTRTLSSEGDQYAQALRSAKAPLAAQLQARGAIVLSQSEHVLNAIMINATADDLAWARTQPGVQSAEFAKKRHMHLNAATALIGAQQVWTQLGGQINAGKNVGIAIIDSGIDITNPMFSGSGFTAPSGFPKTDTTANLAFTNGKVIVARNYICPTAAACSGANSFDLSAADGLGHGSGTASVAGGNCTNTPAGLNICGVAPGAYLGNYKVFDSQGNTTDAAFQQALNDAVADGFLIANYSVGGDAT